MSLRSKLVMGAVLAAAAACAQDAGEQAASVWNGKVSKEWNEARNWTNRIVPASSKTAGFILDSRAGGAFVFDKPFEAASLVVTTNSGQFTITAPLIRFGANIADNREDGWIVEDITMPARVVNNSAKTLVLSGTKTCLAWDTTFDAAGAAISVSGGLEGGGALVKDGKGDMVVSGGRTELSSLTLNGGRFALNGTAASVAGGFKFGGDNKYGMDFILSEGTVLDTPRTENGHIGVLPRFQMSGKSKTTGKPASWDAGGNNVDFHNYDTKIQGGAVIHNANYLQTYLPQGATNGTEFTMSGGAKVYCKWMQTANTWNQGYITAYHMNFTVRGVPGATTENQTVLDVGGGQLHLGKRHDGNCHSSFNTMLITDGAIVQNAAWLCVTHEIGGIGNLLRIDKAAQVTCGGIIVGSTGWTNAVEVAGANTRVFSNKGELHVGGVAQNWGRPHHNALRVSDGASMSGFGTTYIGRSRSEHAEPDYGNNIHVTGGAYFQAGPVIVSHAGPKNAVSSNNWMRVEGRGTRWDAGGQYLVCGYAETSTSMSNSVFVIDGAVATNVVQVQAGSAAWGHALGNRFVLANGARMWSSGNVQVGLVNSQHVHALAEGNVMLVAGGKLGPAYWDMGQGWLNIGNIMGQNAPSRANRFILQPDSRVVNCAYILIGNGRDVATDNTLVLAGGSISATGLYLYKGNGIEVMYSAAGVKPILLEGNIEIGENTYIAPRSSADAPAGRFPIMAWKGDTSKGLENFKLHPKTDTRKWKLEVDAARKQVWLIYSL